MFSIKITSCVSFGTPFIKGKVELLIMKLKVLLTYGSYRVRKAV